MELKLVCSIRPDVMCTNGAEGETTPEGKENGRRDRS